MPIQAPQWTEFLSCPVCRHSFTRNVRPPISLGCGHTICQQCLSTLQRSQCPFDQTPFKTEPENLPINYALLQLVLPGSSSGGGGGGGSTTTTTHGGDCGGPTITTTTTTSVSSVSSSSSSSTSSSSSGGNNNNNNKNSSGATTTTTTGQLEKGGGGGSPLENDNNKVTNSLTNNSNNNGASKRDSEVLSGGSPPEIVPLSVRMLAGDDYDHYKTAKECIEALALYLKPSPTNNASSNLLTRQMQRKVVALICCQLFEEEGRSRAVRAARLLGERAVTELILHHQNPQQLSANLWAAVRARGCQFLGPAMQEEVLKLVLLALEDGSALSRKVLVMFVVQRLEPVYSQASKTSIGHVVQLLYRASCFKVSKREGDSSLMQLKEEFRTYEALRREHDTQIVQIATEAGLRIAPDQWSSLLYGDTTHKSHMQSINDKLQTPESFSQSVQELVLALQRTSDPAHLSNLQPCLKYLADIDPNAEQSVPTWQQVAQACSAVKKVVTGLADFVQHHGSRKLQEITNANPAPKYKVNMCWIYTQRGSCPRGNKCNFAHSEAELNQSKSRHSSNNNSNSNNNSGSSRQSTVPPQSNQMPPPMGLGAKDDFFLMDQFNKKPTLGHNMPSVETSPMRFAGSSGSAGPPPLPMGPMSKGSPLPPPQQSNNLLLPQPYNNNDMMMPPMGPPPQSMNHPGPLHHHPVHHHPGHSPLHVPTGPYTGGPPGAPPPPPPGSLHPYHGSGGGVGHFNAMGPPTPNQLSPLGKFGFDPAKFNPNIRVSPSQQGPPQQQQQQQQPPVMPHPGRSPRNFPNHSGGGGGGFNQNVYMNEMLGPPNPMGLAPPCNNNNNNNSSNLMNKPSPPTPNINVCNDFGHKTDYLQGKGGGGGGVGVHQSSASSFHYRKPNQLAGGGAQQQQQNMMKSPSHLVNQMGGKVQHGGPLNKGGFPGLGTPMTDIMSPRQPVKNSPTFFGKEEMPFWGMAQQQQQHQQQSQQQQQHQPPSQVNVDSLHPPRSAMMAGNHPGPQSSVGNHHHHHHHMAHIYGENPPSSAAAASAANSRRMFDRSDSILTGEDEPHDEKATTNIFGPISKKQSSPGDKLRQQAWLNSSQASSSHTSPRISMHGLAVGGGGGGGGGVSGIVDKQLSPSKELALNHQHSTLSNDPLTWANSPGLVGSEFWSPAPGGSSSLDAVNGSMATRLLWPYSIGNSGRDNNNLDMEDDEKDIENGMREISQKLATELVDDDFAT